jgi:hypothetical protein
MKCKSGPYPRVKMPTSKAFLRASDSNHFSELSAAGLRAILPASKTQTTFTRALKGSRRWLLPSRVPCRKFMQRDLAGHWPRYTAHSRASHEMGKWTRARARRI